MVKKKASKPNKKIISAKGKSTNKKDKKGLPVRAYWQAGGRRGPKTVYLSLGSNVGDREEYIEQAVFLVGKTSGVNVVKRSTNYETTAEGGKTHSNFINAAIEIKTKIAPLKLLDIIQEIEETLGREREVEWGPRTIDIDILLYDDLILSDERLQIPHPLMHERLFVLSPLREIAPNTQHPVIERTIDELCEDRKAEGGNKYDDELPGFKEIKRGAIEDYENW